MMSFFKNGELRLPPGFRFHPTDEELVVQYLKRKVFCCPLPASIIPEVDVCKSDPWDLPGDLEQERYFFSTREAKYPNGNRGKPPHGSRTDWIMHEYRLLTTQTAVPTKTSTQSSAMPMQNWVLCRIFLKRRNGKNEEGTLGVGGSNEKHKVSKTRPVFYDFLARKANGDRTDLNCSSSAASGITVVSSSESDEHEESSSSCNTTFLSLRRKH
ncbi:hypothetical protein L6164_015052 [Bauhinia variegata]|uniref:Uncharacterized protein n=1 Tax=Bauhinia variegata TaxID=167791 RepID=A0ACB9NKN0_BAUVA|nr:hypothetical protein L6164_015052 [Bauhinia variegata]